MWHRFGVAVKFPLHAFVCICKYQKVQVEQ